MNTKPKNLVILGSTGSIGTQTLDIVRAFPDQFRVLGIACNNNSPLFQSQIREFDPRLVSYSYNNTGQASDRTNPILCEMENMTTDPETDLIVAATSSYACMKAVFAGIESGKDIALANKETIIMAGELLMRHAKTFDVSILPIDSEPSAIWQCLQGENSTISRLIITASGGAFRDKSTLDLESVTPEEALEHPTWNMGPKITVDSANLMNKAFEVIESHHLFDVPWQSIEVVIHPESMIHSMVEFEDGSVKAQISPPDMTLPIQYALSHPKRIYNKNISRFDPISTRQLTFKPLDANQYPLFNMAIQIGKQGGTWPSALCGADEGAVEMFLSKQIGFLDIGPLIESILSKHRNISNPSLEDIIATADWAKMEVNSIVCGFEQ
jgi:1-deoxy-D-xylulose-5-phosphate reductoisomerase